MPPPPPAVDPLRLHLLHMVFDMVPGKKGGKEKKENRVWAEEKPSILSVLKFDSEVQDPGRQKANRGGGKDGGVNPHTAISDSSKFVLKPFLFRQTRSFGA